MRRGYRLAEFQIQLAMRALGDIRQLLPLLFQVRSADQQTELVIVHSLEHSDALLDFTPSTDKAILQDADAAVLQCLVSRLATRSVSYLLTGCHKRSKGRTVGEQSQQRPRMIIVFDMLTRPPYGSLSNWSTCLASKRRTAAQGIHLCPSLARRASVTAGAW